MAKELPAGTEVIGIEIDEDEAEQARANIEAAELEADVTVETGDTLEIIPRLEGEFDMAFTCEGERMVGWGIPSKTQNLKAPFIVW